MLQLDYNSNQVIAIIPDSNLDTSSIVLKFTQDYNKLVTFSSASVSKKGDYLICLITGSQLPTASGLYTVDIYSGVIKNTLTWSEWTPTWTTLTETWPTYSGSIILTTGSLIDVERAWVSGSDEISINFYTSSNDNGQFYTYDG